MDNVVKVSITFNRKKDAGKISGADKLNYGELNYLEQTFRRWKELKRDDGVS